MLSVGLLSNPNLGKLAVALENPPQMQGLAVEIFGSKLAGQNGQKRPKMVVTLGIASRRSVTWDASRRIA